VEDVNDRASAVAAELRRSGVADVDSSSLARSLYSSDASLYRVPPAIVIRPRDADEVLAALSACRSAGLPVTARGAGTSIAGNAIGPGAVFDFSAYMHRVGPVDPVARTAVVEPGVVHASLQRAVRPAGLRFGPDPSSHSRCTIGGMIGNNACGSRALGYGRTSDNLVALDVATAAGERMLLGTPQSTHTPHNPRPAGGLEAAADPDGPGNGLRSGVLDRLHERIGRSLADVRVELGRFPRQVSGYGLEHLPPEHGFDVARALAGSEGTLAVVLGAKVRLVPEPAHRALVVLGYPSIAHAADDAPQLLAHRPTACEGLDSRITDVVRASHGQRAVPALPDGDAWLLVEVVGDTAAETVAAAAAVRRDAGTSSALVVSDTAGMRSLWRIREDGAGLAARALTPPGQPGWEDAAVPPERLGGYLRDFDDLLAQHRLHGVPYGHFGDGCVHVRIDFPVGAESGGSVLRSFVEDAARLVASYGGSLSGEHGDGRARGELLHLMYPPRIVELFADVKSIFDPAGLLNPGVLVAPRPMDADLRLTSRNSVRGGLGVRLTADDGDFSAAVHRCTGVGKCLADNSAAGGVMCPSYRATRNEKDSTRGRARVLQDMVAGAFTDGPGPSWRADEVLDVLDLCLACKGCASDCPTGVDMASYKAEVLHQRYRDRVRPRSHYTLGWLPHWAALAQRAPGLVNVAFSNPLSARLVRWSAGIDQRRRLPSLAPQSLRAWSRERPSRHDGRPPVVLWADTFTDFFSPAAGRAAVDLLERAGYRVEVPLDSLCCGLTWMSTGQLTRARKTLAHTVAVLAEYADRGVPVVGLEPSCTAVLRADARELLDDPRVDRVAAQVHTVAELLARTADWEPPDLRDVSVVAQPHCHHASVLGWDADEALLGRAGAQLTRVGGCCGLAGNFGMEKGHYDVSVAVAELDLLPAVRAAPPGSVVLADGFSCRTQLASLGDVDAVHLAELLTGRHRAPGRAVTGGAPDR
jgi:FAD/FMN-containing dehydrogenase/Fe-S oxidoreductase